MSSATFRSAGQLLHWYFRWVRHSYFSQTCNDADVDRSIFILHSIAYIFMAVEDKTIFHITMATTIISMTMFFISLYFGWFGRFIEIGSVFCEAFHPGLIKQPVNTWSNLAFVAVGLFVAWSLASRSYHQNLNMLTQGQFYGTLFSCLTVLIGPGSMALHGSGAYLGGVLDRRSMYLIVSLTVSYAALRLYLLQSTHFVFIFLFVFNTCVWAEAQSDIHFIFNSFGNAAFAFYILVTVVFEVLNNIIRKPRCATIWAFTSLGSLLLSAFIRMMTFTGGPWCDPYSIIQGHAVWHVLAAFSLYCLFRFYVSEDYERRLIASLCNV